MMKKLMPQQPLKLLLDSNLLKYQDFEPSQLVESDLYPHKSELI